MQLSCPNCGTPIVAENINIQRMAAVCSACHTVFQFDPADTQTKRRKVKKPAQITVDESDGKVDIAFRTNFRLDQNETFISSAISSALFTFITAIFVSIAFIKPGSAFLAAGFGLATAALYYWLALVVYNKTHIALTDESLKVSRRPLPNILTRPNTISLSGIARVRYEETAPSRKEGYDTPRYHVWAEMVDGNRKLIVGDVIEDYAVFISQQLNEHLDLGTPPAVSRMLADESDPENDQITDEPVAQAEAARSLNSAAAGRATFNPNSAPGSPSPSGEGARG